MPAAARIEQFKKFMWITTCIAAPVLENRHLKYVFRAQPYGTQWGRASTEMLTYYSKEVFGKDPKDLKVAIIHEDGAYGVDVARGAHVDLGARSRREPLRAIVEAVRVAVDGLAALAVYE